MTWLKRLGCGALLFVLASVVYVAVADTGIVSVHYAESPNADHEVLRKSVSEWGAFDQAASDIDAAYLVPRDLTISFSDCGEPNAFYDPEQTAIFMCYELVSQLADDYRRYASSEEALATSVWQTTFFVFYHELGHALIDMLDLPVTGREEDAVDQLATLVLLEAGDAGRDAALRGAEWFQFNGRKSRGRQQFWGEHSLDEQRYFNVLCWVYGSDTTAHAALLERAWGLPEDRAQRCPEEYQRMSRAWETMLAQYRH